MSSKLDLDPGLIASCRQAATQIAAGVGEKVANCALLFGFGRLASYDYFTHVKRALANSEQ